VIVRDLAASPVIDARDGTHLCELLHPSHFSGAEHFIANTGGVRLEFLAIVDPMWSAADDERMA
jgi:hypothetical protein